MTNTAILFHSVISLKIDSLNFACLVTFVKFRSLLVPLFWPFQELAAIRHGLIQPLKVLH